MRFGSLATLVALVGSCVLAACGGGGGGSSSNAQMRLINASVGYSSLDFTIGTTKANTAVAYATAGSYSDVNTGATDSQVLTSVTGTTLASLKPTLTGGSKYSVIAYGWSGALKTTLLQEEEAVPTTAGTSKLLVLNLAADAGALDVYLTGPNDSLDTASPTASSIGGGSSSGYVSLNSGSFRVRVTGAGNRTDLRLDIPSISLEALKVHSLVITPTQGGLLVNGIFMQQQGTPTNFASTTARARVVASLTNSPQVGATFGGKSLLQTSLAPTIGEYVAVSAGTGALVATINGVAVPLGNQQLLAGGDYTLMIWGDTSAPQLAVLNDDNRLPTTAGTAKLRLINGVSGLNAGLTMTLDFTPIATNILPGSSSGILSVNATTGGQLEVTSPTSATPVYTNTNFSLPQGSVYTVFMLGNQSGILGRPRRDR